MVINRYHIQIVTIKLTENFSQYYTSRREVNQNDIQFNGEFLEPSETQYLESSSLTTSIRTIVKDDDNMQIRQTTSNDTSYMNEPGGIRNTGSRCHSENNPLIDIENPNGTQKSIFDIFSKIWIWISSIFITYVVCLSIFPSIAALVDSTDKGKVKNLFCL